MPAKKPFPFPRPYACDFPECTQSFAEFAHLRSHQRSHQNKNKKLKTANPAFSTPPPSSNSPSESHLDQINNTGLTPLSTAPSSPRVANTPLTAQEYLQQRKLQLQQQQLLLLAPAVPAPVVRKNKRKQPTPIKSPKRPDCLEKPPGIVFVFPTWLDIPSGNNPEKQLASNVQTREASEESLEEAEKGVNGEQDLAHVDVEDAEDVYQRKKRPTPLRLNSSDFVVLVHPTTDKQLLAATLEGLKPQQQQQSNSGSKDARGLKKAPLSQDHPEEVEAVGTQMLTPSVPTGTTSSPTGVQPMEDGEEDEEEDEEEKASEENRRAEGDGGEKEEEDQQQQGLMGKATSMIHERMAEGQVVMA